MKSLFFIGKLPKSPKSYGKPHPLQPKVFIHNPATTFTRWGELAKKSLDDHILTWLYKEEGDTETKKFPI